MTKSLPTVLRRLLKAVSDLDLTMTMPQSEITKSEIFISYHEAKSALKEHNKTQRIMRRSSERKKK